MTDTAVQVPASQSERSLRTIWRAVLKWASHPLWEEGASDQRRPLWITPEDVAGQRSAAYPHDEAIRRVLFRYSTVLGIPFSFRTGVGRYSPPAPSDAIHVHVFALPTPAIFFGIWPRVPLVPLLFAYGVPLREGVHWVLTPGTHVGRGHFLTDEEGHVVAEYRGTNLYCLFDLLGQDSLWVPLMLRKHLDIGLPRVIPALAPPALMESWEEKLRALREETEAEVCRGRQRLHELAREAYISACRDGVADEMRFLQADISFLEAAVEEMGRRVATDTRRLTDGQRRLRFLQNGLESPELPAPDLAAIRALPEVHEVQRVGGCITVLTHPLLVEHEGRRYRLGAFQLSLYDSGEVRINNLSGRVGIFDHPNVCQGRPRLAGIREGVAKLLGEAQVAAAAEVLIDFLRTVDPADWRVPIQCWPEAGHEAEHAVLASA
jgi:uncharacterized protein (DUF433 family)